MEWSSKINKYLSNTFTIMKQNVIQAVLVCVSIFMAFSCTKSNENSSEQDIANGTGCLSFERTIIDYGVIPKGADGLRVFNFSNNTNEPAIIKAAKGSCGCLVPTYPKEPIMPGESGAIEVRYDTQRVGVFTKTATIETSCSNNPTITLTVKGEVTS
jgi:Protein of unknown function (DUF1573)